VKKLIFISFLFGVLLCAPCAGKNVVKDNGTASSTFTGKVDYDKYFTGERLRIDFVFAGGKEEQKAYLQQLHREASWAGSPNGLVDPFGYGEYYFEAFSGDQVIFSKGFSTWFQEWRSTAQASKVQMAFNQCMWMPYPKDVIKIVLYERKKATGRYEPFFSCEIDPSDKLITHQKENDFRLVPLQYKGDSDHKLDLLFAAEGFTADKMDKLHADANRFMEYLFTFEPYASRRDDFNVWLLESVSQEGGVDKPHWDKWVNTALDAGFYTFYIDRYLTISDHKKIASMVSGAPFDALFILADETKYGGGGIFNSYAMGTVDDRQSEIVFIHEFGHSFAGLADEYYTSEVAYEDYYPASCEPWEPNITNLVDFDSKWKDMVDASLPVPAPNDPAYAGRVGLFEGAGYMAKGCYRPYFECRMLNNTAPSFCPVCQRAINRMIDFYVK